MLAQCGDDRCEWQWHNAATTAPPAKKQKVSLFGRYRVTATQSGSSQEKTPAQVLASYTDMISVTDMQLTDIFKNEQFGCIRPLLQKVLCVPASSAPVERVFSQSGLIMKPNRARMSDALLGELVFLDCNDFWPWIINKSIILHLLLHV